VGSPYTCRPDLVGFVNGLPWVVIELKKPGVPARAAFDENLTHYKHQIPQLFWFNAMLIASNGTDSRVGTLTADWERFFEWKRIEREDEPRRVSLEVMLRGTCDRTRLLDLVENFTLFSEHRGADHHRHGGKGGANPVKDKAQPVAVLREAIAEATDFCSKHGVNLAAMEALPLGAMERLTALENAINALIGPDALRREFFGHEKFVTTLYSAVKPDPAAIEFSVRIAGIATLAGAIRAKLSPNPPDIATILQQIGGCSTIPSPA
jgi:hypothetical protein